jgi:hypothetical protein
MNAEERYAVIWFPEKRCLARWLRPIEAAAYVEMFNRLVHAPLRRAQLVAEPIEPPAADARGKSRSK